MTDQYPERPISPFAGGFFNPFSEYGYTGGPQDDDGDGGGGGRTCKKNSQCPPGKKCIDGTCQIPGEDGDGDGDGGNIEVAPDGSRCRPKCGPNKKCRQGVCVPRQGGGGGGGNNRRQRQRRRDNRQGDAVAAFGGATDTAPSFRSFTGLGFEPGSDPGGYGSEDLSGQGWGSGSAGSSAMAEYTPPPNPFFAPAQRSDAPTNPYMTPVSGNNPFMPRRRR